MNAKKNRKNKRDKRFDQFEQYDQYENEFADYEIKDESEIDELPETDVISEMQQTVQESTGSEEEEYVESFDEIDEQQIDPVAERRRLRRENHKLKKKNERNLIRKERQKQTEETSEQPQEELPKQEFVVRKIQNTSRGPRIIIESAYPTVDDPDQTKDYTRPPVAKTQEKLIPREVELPSYINHPDLPDSMNQPELPDLTISFDWSNHHREPELPDHKPIEQLEYHVVSKISDEPIDGFLDIPDDGLIDLHFKIQPEHPPEKESEQHPEIPSKKIEAVTDPDKTDAFIPLTPQPIAIEHVPQTDSPHIFRSDKASVLEVHGANMRFANNQVLRDINLTVHRGETVAVIGESGCGKTVLLKMLIGLLWPESGEVVFDGVAINGLSERELTRLRTRYGFVFQQAALFDSMSIGENVAFPLRQHTNHTDTEIHDIVEHLLIEVGLNKNVVDKKPAELSGGMRKRVGFARALVMEPELMLYDEPTTGLDPIMSDVINELILRTRERHQVSGIVVTHDMVSARKVANRIVMMYPLSRLKPNEPQIIFDGTPEEIEKCTDPRVSQFLRGEAGERMYDAN